MRRLFIAMATISLIAVAACSSSAATTAPTSAPTAAATAAPTAAPASAGGGGGGGGALSVAIKNFTFSPANLDAKVGAKVTWTNGDDTAHTVTFDDASVTSSGNLNTGATFEGTFAAAGTFTYHCKIHPTMKGTVNVT